MRSIGRYDLLGEIGRGGMGIVFLARQRDLDRLVALKQLNGSDGHIPELTKRFARESQLGGSFNHPNIVTVHDYFSEDGTPYIAMEYVPGGSLRSHVGRLSLAQITGMLEGLLAGLATVEPAQIVHRDLKPENVLVTADGRVKIADFGIAKTSQPASISSFMTSTRTTVGTPAYMAPEQALSDEIGPWTDLYSVGVIAYEQLVGRIPFHDSRSSIEFLLRREKEPVPPVIQNRPELSPALSEWVARLLVRDPAERVRSATQAWDQLEEIALEMLDPRWRRDAPLPLLSQPETESGFYSYGRELTGADKPRKLSSQGPSVGSPISAGIPPKSGASHGEQPSEGLHQQRPSKVEPATNRHIRPHYYALTAALTIVLGFAAASATGTKAPSQPVAAVNAPSQVYVATLSAAVSRLNEVRATAGAELEHAKTAAAQATAAQRLARAHDMAAKAIRNVSPAASVRATDIAIVSSLTRIAGGYTTMARAARGENRHSFDDGRVTVNTATISLAAGLARLHEVH